MSTSSSPLPACTPCLSALTELSLHDICHFAVQNAERPEVSIGFNHLAEVQTALILQYIAAYITTKRLNSTYTISNFESDLDAILSEAQSRADLARKRASLRGVPLAPPDIGGDRVYERSS